MPNIPSIVPLILAGVIIGSILRKTDISISWKLLILGSLLGGLGNLAHAGVLFFFQGQEARPTFSQRPPTDFQLPSNLQFTLRASLTTFNPISFLVTSFVTGAIMILVILIVAVLTLRLRGRTTVDE
jgi:hypothetical protein